MVTGVPVDSLVYVWPRVLPMIEPALADGETPAQVLSELYQQKAQLWAIIEDGEPLAAVVTQIITLKSGDKACNIWAAGGKGINRWADYVAMIEDWAAENDCQSVIVEKTRKGMQRILKGYTVTHVTLKKDI